ncbi:MAG TPA: GAF domain-containing sensor histidine kinase [Actinomycetota bacterium]
METEHIADEARRLERQLIVVRWFLASFGAIQLAFSVRDRAGEPTYVLALGAAIVLGLSIGNLLLGSALDTANLRRLRLMGAVAYGLDAAAVLGLVWLASDGPADPVWVVGYLLPLEGAARWGMAGALVGATLFLGGEIARELDAGIRDPSEQAGAAAIAFRAMMAFVVAGVAGSLASSLRREAALARTRAAVAEDAVDHAESAAESEREARGEVAAFHAAILAEADAAHLGVSLRRTAEAIARGLGSEALGILLRERGQVGETAFAAVGAYGDPGYLVGEQLSPVSDPVAAAAADGQAVLAGPDAVAPMIVQGEVVGALHEHGIEHEPDEERLRLLVRLADQLGLVLESARLRADQEETVQRLRELDEMKNDFVAITSHELRTPLSGIRGFVDMLRRRGDDLPTAERDEYLGIVLLQTDRLISLVDDLLVVSRVEAGKLTLEPQEIDVHTFVSQLARSFGADEVRIVLDPSAGAPERILVDPRRLTQILTNLVHNALKFSPDATPVTVSWTMPVEGTVSFIVADEGPGIDPGELSRIFERFHQTERSIAHTEGFGLGLYITKLLAEAMGGWVDVASELDRGTTFTVTLPVSRTLPAPARPSAARRQS